MSCLFIFSCSSKIRKAYPSDNHRLFTYCCVLVTFLGSYLRVVSAVPYSLVVSRQTNGDRFTNLNVGNPQNHCKEIGANCIDDLHGNCIECVCNPSNPTYHFGLNRCVSSDQLHNSSGCLYKELMVPRKALLAAELPTLDLSKKSTTSIHAPLRMNRVVAIACDIENSSSFLNMNGEWVTLPNITDILMIHVEKDPTGLVKRFLNLNWEGVKDRYYKGQLVKLEITCREESGIDQESDCFLFKTEGKYKENRMTAPPGTEGRIVPTTKTTTAMKASSSTENIVVKNYAYSVSRTVIIAIAAGVGLVILIIIVLAICFVRYRTRKSQEVKKVVKNEPPKVHITPQARFSLIQESAQIEPLEPSSSDYACLQQKRESYDPYCSLQQDDVDLNVIDQILKDAVSMDSMTSSSAPRYNCRLSGDQTVVIETAPLRTPKTPKYHVLEGPGDDTDPDYEEVDSSDEDDDRAAARLLQTKPDLPEREYHILEPPIPSAPEVYSEC